ncbi:MAG TPA: DegT/DnrJ/EryC1/StrS family aminotransferase, partial [Candidatus Aenigmarchaeota archaeon]|nr:DegT/DnrJ/EryC1/StrS family aminotransferase [Candidatus Aenigmarchaeota archaeon]
VRSYGRVEGEKNYFTSSETPDYVEIGFNFRMSNLLASLGISQLEKVDKNIKMRRKNAEYMTKKLSGINEILPPRPPEGYFHVYQMYTIRVLAGRETRDKLMKYLAERGIMSKVYFEPLHRTTIFKKLGYGNVRLPKTEELSSQVLTLPMYPHMKREEMDFIVDTIREFFEVSGA